MSNQNFIKDEFPEAMNGLKAIAGAIGKCWYELDVVQQDQLAYTKILAKISFHAGLMADRYNVAGENYILFQDLLQKTVKRNYLERVSEYLQKQMDEKYRSAKILNFRK